MKARIAVLLICFVTLPAYAANSPDFSGRWVFNPGKSKNIGMMSDMKLTETVKQSPASVDVATEATFQENNQQTTTHYDLTGKAAANDSPMAGPSETVSKWEGDKLVTTWTSVGAVAGTKTVRTEIWSLSPDGKTMTVEWVRGSNPPVVMLFDKK
ncbi:MAG TPA: hypothetical protein VHM93_24395 [Candidatus Acidoferrum sp.]|nr:hypothetical protein [Candidatus Acidoferrum sp.]